VTDNWWYLSNGERKGPIGEQELHRLLLGGTLNATSRLWKKGMKNWVPASQIDEFHSLLGSLPPEVPRTSLTWWVRVKRHLGSTICLLVGGLALISGIARPRSTMIAGIVIILGALAYRSAKKRKLGEAKSSLTRQVLEVALLVLICIVILAQNNLKYVIATDPVPNVIIPGLAILAYVIIASTPQRLLRPSPSQEET
jgi:hypothetical protein